MLAWKNQLVYETCNLVYVLPLPVFDVNGFSPKCLQVAGLTTRITEVEVLNRLTVTSSDQTGNCSADL
jgi:hypothetical protein